MHPEFWLARWQDNQIGFHQAGGNELLRQYWRRLELPANAHVLVPLCGKTVDMAWLAAQGHGVTGVELSERAAAAFFAEQGLAPKIATEGEFICYAAQGLQIWVGDIFALPDHIWSHADAFYDRAALIALPADLRRRYAGLLCDKLEASTGLLISIAYPPGDMPGPPFSVDATELESLFSPAMTVQTLASHNALEDNAHLRDKGVSELTESVYMLRSNPCNRAG